MKTAVLAEKPSVGKDIARVLGCSRKTKSYIEGNNYIVTWAMGHLVELADPGEHDPAYREWKLEDLPIIPERMKHKVIRRTSGQFNTVKSILKRSDVDMLVIATDAGREGELVARWIMRLSGYRGPFKRLWISSQTDKAIKEGFDNLKPGRDYDNLMKAAECRAEADWIIGFNITRALSCRYDTRLSAGRVQTPTLAIIGEREKQIRNFIPKPFWTAEADFDGFSASWRGPSGGRIFPESRAEELRSKIEGEEAVVTAVSRKKKRVPPPPAYDLTSLQQEANKSHGWTAKKTLKVLQGLYERHKIVSYPRTDSRHLTTDIQPTIGERMKALARAGWERPVRELLKTDLNPGKRLFDDSRVSDHHAIIPTEQTAVPERLSADEKLLWTMIVRRFLAVFSHDYEYIRKTAELEAKGEKFIVSSSRIESEGWRAAEFREIGGNENESGGSGIIDGIEKGERLKIKSLQLRQQLTSPPPLYTEGSLLAAMENPSSFIGDKRLKETLRQGGGLGTPATRADIIEKLISGRYVERAGNHLKITPAGEEVLELAPEQLKSPALTAEWEIRLGNIAEGQEKAGKFTADIKANAAELVESVRGSRSGAVKDFSSKPCPLCGRMMMPVKDRRGNDIHVCRSLSCGYEEEAESRDGFRKPSRKEKAVSRKLMKQYSGDEPETFTLADMIKQKQKGK